MAMKEIIIEKHVDLEGLLFDFEMAKSKIEKDLYARNWILAYKSYNEVLRDLNPEEYKMARISEMSNYFRVEAEMKRFLGTHEQYENPVWNELFSLSSDQLKSTAIKAMDGYGDLDSVSEEDGVVFLETCDKVYCDTAVTLKVTEDGFEVMDNYFMD